MGSRGREQHHSRPPFGAHTSHHRTWAHPLRALVAPAGVGPPEGRRSEGLGAPAMVGPKLHWLGCREYESRESQDKSCFSAMTNPLVM